MVCNNLEEIRTNINRLDNEIIKLIAESETYIIQASVFKKDERGVKDIEQVEKVITKLRSKTKE